jgi:phosphoglycerate dehydrogenase-like enzyme
MPQPLIVSLPDDKLVADLERTLPPLGDDRVRFVEWALAGAAPVPHIDIVVPPYQGRVDWGRLDGVSVGLVQSQSIGYDGVREQLPAGIVYANASSVHETATAELAVGLLLASQRGIDDFVRQAEIGEWRGGRRPSLADRTVLIVGYGGVGRAVERRLAGFEVARVIRVASRARADAAGTVHGIDELATLLPDAEVLVIATPLNDTTRGLIGGAELALLPDDAVVVNVARGPVLDTAAVLAEAGRLRFALDVTDPEPLPSESPLWDMPNVLISPHSASTVARENARITSLFCENLLYWLDGRHTEMRNVLDPALLY